MQAKLEVTKGMWRRVL